MNTEDLVTMHISLLRETIRRYFGRESVTIYFDGTPATVLAARMFVDALGKQNVCCVTTTDVGCMNVSLATSEAAKLGVRHLVIPIVLPVASIIQQITYAGVVLTGDRSATIASRRVASVVLDMIAGQLDSVTVSTMPYVSGYDPLDDMTTDELESLFSYYNISIHANKEEE